MTDPIRPDRPEPARPPRSASPMRGALVVVLLALAGFVAWRLLTPSAVPPATETAASQGADTAPQAPPAEAAPTQPQHPVATADPSGDPQAEAAALASALADLLGPATREHLLLDDLARRVVATVDNLARAHAPAGVWPIHRTPGRFDVHKGGDGTLSVAPDNAARYAPLVAIAESVDVAALARLYARHYPLFQRAYAEIGFPGRHFNDRLVAVIDHLLQAPRPAWPVALTLTEVRSDTPSTRPWVRYEFADPALEALSAGQKIMIRVGPEHRRRLEAVLSAFRRQVADGALAR